MSKYKNVKIWLIFSLFFLGFITLNATDVNASSLNTMDVNVTKVGDKVYVIFREGSHTRVGSGVIERVGKINSKSKVSWDNCNSCDKWIANSRLFYTLNEANKIAEQMELDNLSMSDCGKRTILDSGILDLLRSIPYINK